MNFVEKVALSLKRSEHGNEAPSDIMEVADERIHVSEISPLKVESDSCTIFEKSRFEQLYHQNRCVENWNIGIVPLKITSTTG